MRVNFAWDDRARRLSLRLANGSKMLPPVKRNIVARLAGTNQAREIVFDGPLPREIIKLNDFGASIGGPIIKDKFFFYAAMAASISPLTRVSTATVLSPDAQQGLFSYRTASGALQTANVLQLAGAAGFPGGVHQNISQQFSKINSVLNRGTLIPTSDPNLFTLSHVVSAKQTIPYPTLRIDYSLNNDQRFSLSYNQTRTRSFPERTHLE